MSTITVTFSSLRPDVKRHLSIMGKRERDKQGKNIFASITLGSPEEDIIDVYLQSGANSILSALSQLLFSYNVSATTAEATFKYTRSSHVVSGVQKGISSYCVYFAVCEYLAMDFPELAKKYYDLAERTRRDVIMLAFSKLPPNSSGVDYDYDSGGDDSGGGSSTPESLTVSATQDDGVYGFDVPASTIISMYELNDYLKASAGSSVTLRIKAGSSVVSTGISLPYTFTEELINTIHNDYGSSTLRFTPPMEQTGSITSSSVLTLTTNNNS